MLGRVVVRSAVCLGLLASAGASNAEPQVEVLHWWTSGGEARAVGVLQQEFAANGGTWTDMPVAGGGGDAAMTALRARVLAGNAPTAVQLKGPAIQEWYEEGVLADISAVAEANKAGPTCCRLDRGPYAMRRHLVRRAGERAPRRLDLGQCRDPRGQRHRDAHHLGRIQRRRRALQAAGIIPLAHGGQAWQDATVFETVVLGIGGPDFFRRRWSISTKRR
jgi:glucose/mannose transport system substrate-binding protein